MADYNRNQRGSNRNWNQQNWNDNRNEKNYRSENRGYGNSYDQGFDDDDDSGWQSRYQRDDYNRMGNRYSTGRYGRHYGSDMDSGNWNDRDSGYSSNYGSGYSSGLGSGYSNPGSRHRDLYDRDYEGMNRSTYSNAGTRFGASNYGSYGDRSRFNENRGYSTYGGYSGSNYGGNWGTQDYERNRGGDEDRTWWDRATDEVSSWFGNEDAERRRERDRIMNYRGKGPKNYTRSDERIKEDINDRLADDPFIDASEVDVTVSNGEVTLTGSVDHRSTKRRAEDLAEAVSGVKNVENRIRVMQNSSMSDRSSSDSGMGSSTPSTSTSPVAGSERTRSANSNKGQYVTG